VGNAFTLTPSLRVFFACPPPAQRARCVSLLDRCNKFRHHQAREILIETLERQLERREDGLALLERRIADADAALVALRECG